MHPMHPCGVVCTDLQCSVLSCKQILLASFWVPKYDHVPLFIIIMCLVSSALWTYHGSVIPWISRLYGVRVHNKLTYLLTCTPHICCCQEWMILWGLDWHVQKTVEILFSSTLLIEQFVKNCPTSARVLGDSFFLNPVNWTICEELPTSVTLIWLQLTPLYSWEDNPPF